MRDKVKNGRLKPELKETLKGENRSSSPGHHMFSGTLALIKYLVIYMNVKQNSGPNK